RRAALGQGIECGGDVRERDADLLRDANDGDAAQHVAAITALVASGAVRPDQPALLVEMQRRNRDAAASRHLADRQFLLHRLTSSLVEVVASSPSTGKRWREK